MFFKALNDVAHGHHFLILLYFVLKDLFWTNLFACCIGKKMRTFQGRDVIIIRHNFLKSVHGQYYKYEYYRESQR